MPNITIENNASSLMTVGWDIGGAHVKMVMMEATGTVVAVQQIACPLWKGITQLTTVLDILSPLFAPYSHAIRHAITMTGELADVFDSRQQGVLAIADCLEKTLNGPLYYFALAPHQDGHAMWIDKTKLKQHWREVASANWAASATFIATRIDEGVVTDIGSSTTDIMFIQDHCLASIGKSDAERMATGELLYTGVVRTPVMAVGAQFPFRGQWVNVAAEYFATTADVYRLTGELCGQFDMADTADGQDKSLISSARRLARMIGYDVEEATMAEWVQFAAHIKAIHQESIRRALLRIFSRYRFHQEPIKHSAISESANGVSHLPLIAMGAGAFLLQDIAKQWGLEVIAAEQFVLSDDKHLQQEAQVCFPAFAVAALLIQQGD